MGRQRDDGYDHDGPNTYPLHLRNQMVSKKGQSFLREMLSTLDAMAEKKLIADAIATEEDGCTCGLGAVILARRVAAGEDRQTVLAELAAINVDTESPDFGGEDMHEWAARVMGVPLYLAYELAAINDHRRWERAPCFDVPRPFHGSQMAEKIVYLDEDPADRFARVRRAVARMVRP